MNEQNGARMSDECDATKKILATKHECYVLITCSRPDADGEMQVEMDYAGDIALASYLLQGAQKMIDEKAEMHAE